LLFIKKGGANLKKSGKIYKGFKIKLFVETQKRYKMRVILGSESNQRQKALDILGIGYEVRPSEIDDSKIKGKTVLTRSKKLAEAKAKDVAKKDKELQGIIITGDCFMSCDKKMYDKPNTENEAINMIKEMSEKKIDIIGSVAVYNTMTKKMMSYSGKYTVKLRELTEYEIQDYAERYPIETFAGGIDSDGLLRFSESIHGKYPFLAGFPMDKLIEFLRENGIRV